MCLLVVQAQLGGWLWHGPGTGPVLSSSLHLYLWGPLRLAQTLVGADAASGSWRSSSGITPLLLPRRRLSSGQGCPHGADRDTLGCEAQVVGLKQTGFLEWGAEGTSG